MAAERGEPGEWDRAGRIAAAARELGAKRIGPGVRRCELADEIEEYIRGEGAEPAFPTNLSRNVEAAHFTPPPDDPAVFEIGDLVKIDVGAQIHGAIADTAITVEVGGGRRHETFLRAVREGVEAGIARVKAGVAVDSIGSSVEAAIHARGLKPVVNLTGHSIERYLLHAGKSIPNVSGMSHDRLQEGEVIAIEPFATNGAGEIANGAFGNIVRFRGEPTGATAEVRAIFEKYRTLPFTARWLTPAERKTLGTARRFLQVYPVFVERDGGLVSQAEHTVRVLADGAEVLTRAT